MNYQVLLGVVRVLIALLRTVDSLTDTDSVTLPVSQSVPRDNSVTHKFNNKNSGSGRAQSNPAGEL